MITRTEAITLHQLSSLHNDITKAPIHLGRVQYFFISMIPTITVFHDALKKSMMSMARTNSSSGRAITSVNDWIFKVFYFPLTISTFFFSSLLLLPIVSIDSIVIPNQPCCFKFAFLALNTFPEPFLSIPYSIILSLPFAIFPLKCAPFLF